VARANCRRPWLALLAAFSLLAMGAGPANGRATAPRDELSADVDGKPIPTTDVGKWYCHDFDYPVIHCFTEPAKLDASTEVATSALASVNYVLVFEFTTYQGAFMYMSEDYSILALIGWNDRISSFQVKNSQSGAFWTDWLYSGTRYNFCCNQNVGSLGSYNDSFSSVFHN